MRLIDADELIKELKSLSIVLNGKQIFSDDAKDTVLRIINEHPTAYDVDKVVEELEKVKTINVDVGYGTIYKTIRRDVAIEIVKQVGAANDVCEWHKLKNGNAYKCNTHAEIYDSRVLDWCKCPYCGKKIKVVE